MSTTLIVLALIFAEIYVFIRTDMAFIDSVVDTDQEYIYFIYIHIYRYFIYKLYSSTNIYLSLNNSILFKNIYVYKHKNSM